MGGRTATVLGKGMAWRISHKRVSQVCHRIEAPDCASRGSLPNEYNRQRRLSRGEEASAQRRSVNMGSPPWPSKGDLRCIIKNEHHARHVTPPDSPISYLCCPSARRRKVPRKKAPPNGPKPGFRRAAGAPFACTSLSRHRLLLAGVRPVRNKGS